LDRWDKIIVMDKRNLEDVKKMGFKNVSKLLKEDVPDPYFYDTEEGMNELFEMIKKGVEIILKSLD
jgi:protein-tyrosine-phosphatase